MFPSQITYISYYVLLLQAKTGHTLHPLFGIQLGTQRFDLQTTTPMYPRRLVQLVSKIAGPPSNLLHYCYSHTQMKVSNPLKEPLYVKEL